jgi:hypothetical protein
MRQLNTAKAPHPKTPSILRMNLAVQFLNKKEFKLQATQLLSTVAFLQ